MFMVNAAAITETMVGSSICMALPAMQLAIATLTECRIAYGSSWHNRMDASATSAFARQALCTSAPICSNSAGKFCGAGLERSTCSRRRAPNTMASGDLAGASRAGAAGA